MDGVIGDLAATVTRWRLWWLLGMQDIRMRYRRSAIGPFWISISMAATVFGIGLLYSQIFALEFKQYLSYLGAGFLVWGFISMNTTEAGGVLIEAENHLRSARISPSIFAAQMVHRNLIVFVHNLVVIAILLVYCGVSPTPALLAAPVGVLILSALGFFTALTLGPICLRYRDLIQIVMNFVQITFFLTPILWMPSQGRIDPLWVKLNPFYHLVEIVRQPILGAYPSLENWAYSLGALVVVAMTALFSLALSRRKIFVWL
ncbi:MAG: ABC transporter permease [Amphiplicatus sp.]